MFFLTKSAYIRTGVNINTAQISYTKVEVCGCINYAKDGAASCTQMSPILRGGSPSYTLHLTLFTLLYRVRHLSAVFVMQCASVFPLKAPSFTTRIRKRKKT